jgi:hypothetical protein
MLVSLVIKVGFQFMYYTALLLLAPAGVRPSGPGERH